MAITETSEQARLQELAQKHLWMHFTRMGAYDEHELPIIVRGEGCYVYDEHGKRYLDGLSALFCVNAGHGRAELGEAAARQAKELGFYTNWSYAHPLAIELAARIAALAPGDLNRVFFTSGGSEAVESRVEARRASTTASAATGTRYKIISRETAYHGTTMGALIATGITAAAHAVRAAGPGRRTRAEHEQLPLARGRDPLWAADRSRSGSSSRGRRPSPP